MKLLTLVRHAKSSWQAQGVSDHERTLNPRGLNDAPLMAKRIEQRVALPDRILCSSARRTLQTCDIFNSSWLQPQADVAIDDALYLSSTGTLQGAIESTDIEVEHLMVIAHNPGLEQLGMLLHPNSPKSLPTCAVLHFEIDQNSFSLENLQRIQLRWYDYPKNPN